MVRIAAVASCAIGASLAGAAPAAEGTSRAHPPETQPPDEAANDDPLLVRPFFQILNAEATLEGENGGGEIEFVPNATNNVGVKVGAWGLAASVSVGVGHVESVAAYGDSENFNFELSYPFDVADYELYLTGFIHYHDTLSTIDGAGERQILDGAKLVTGGLDAVLMLDSAFSLDAALGDFAPREGSSGSWFLRASLGYWLLGFAREPTRLLVPSERRFDLERLAELNRLTMSFATIGAGYMYDWNVFHHFFLTGLGNLGLDASAVQLWFVSRDRDSVPALGPAAAIQLGLSYVGSSFHTGLTANGTADLVSARGVQILGQRVNVLLFAGLRF